MAACRSAAAGMRGPDIRSDCWVEVREPASGPPSIEVFSRVEAIYGQSTRALVSATLESLAANDLSVTLQDSGALPFTLQARLEAAVRRLRPPGGRAGGGVALPALNPATRYPADRDRLRRSRLYLPGNTPKFFINAGLHGPDAVILDLEDSVPPEEKDAARMLVRAALRAVSFYGAEKMVRINRLPDGLEDVRTLAPHGVHTFLIPKVEHADDVRAVHDLIVDLRRDGIVPDELFLIPIVESARGVAAAGAIASAAPSVVALAIGLEDYTADIGAQRTTEGRESLWAISQVVNAARAAGVQPLGSVFSNVDDAGGLQAYTQSCRQLGFEGVGCIHPRQVRAVHDAFTPVPAEIERASRIAAGYEAARALGQGVVAVDGTMVDAPVAARAYKTLRLAAAADAGTDAGSAFRNTPAEGNGVPWS